MFEPFQRSATTAALATGLVLRPLLILLLLLHPVIAAVVVISGILILLLMLLPDAGVNVIVTGSFGIPRKLIDSVQIESPNYFRFAT